MASAKHFLLSQIDINDTSNGRFFWVSKRPSLLQSAISGFPPNLEITASASSFSFKCLSFENLISFSRSQGFQSYIQSQSQSQSFSLQSQSQSFYLKNSYQSQSQFLLHQSFNIFRVFLTKCQKTIFLLLYFRNGSL